MREAIRKLNDRRERAVNEIESLFKSDLSFLSFRACSSDKQVIDRILYILRDEIPKEEPSEPNIIKAFGSPIPPSDFPAVRMPLINPSRWWRWSGLATPLLVALTGVNAMPIIIVFIKWVGSHLR